MSIRQLKHNEVNLHRTLRLQALQDSPNSFAESFTEVKDRPMTYWETLTQSVTEANRHVMFLWCDDQDVHGCVYGLLDRTRDDGVRVGGMWVNSAQRKRGIGTALLQAVVLWGDTQHRTHFGLWVLTHQTAAIALYQRFGFVETGERKLLPNQPGINIMAMELSV